ncbi:MAG: hypothetical protein ACO36I_04840, partial [Candidatus Latescibacterota bacterium]
MMHQKSILRTLSLYALSIIALTYYGIEVCPFLETLSTVELLTILAIAFAISGICRALILHALENTSSPHEVNLQKPWQYLQIDIAMWLFTGILVTVWNTYHYQFPIESGFKVVLGCLTLGIFSASYLALKVEHELIQCLSEDNTQILIHRGAFFSITTKFLIFTILSVTVVTGVLLLLIYK